MIFFGIRIRKVSNSRTYKEIERGKCLTYITKISAITAMLYMLGFIYFGKYEAPAKNGWIINIGMFSLWALAHSFMSTALFKKLYVKIFPSKYKRSTFVFISSIGLMGVLYHWQPLHGILWQLQGIPHFLSSTLFIAFAFGAGINLHVIDYKAFIGIKNLHKNIQMHITENGQSNFSLNGMYGYCRHPTYLFLILLFWVTPAMTYAKLEFILLATLYLLVGTIHEETNLLIELGSQYEIYRQNVPMWLPRRKAWKPGGKGR